MRKAILLACILLAAACKGDKYDGPLADCTVSSIGSCTSVHAEQCGFQLSCTNERRLALQCTPPPSGAKEMDCQCVENGVLGRSVKLVNPPQGDGRAVAASACGWK